MRKNYMHNRNFRLPLAAALLASSFLVSCSDDDPEPVTYDKYPATFYTVNEGTFGAGNGSIGYYNGLTDGEAVTDPDLFKTVNNRALGDVVQSLSFYNGKGYVVVNNSQKVEVVNAGNFSSVASIDAGSPRFFQGISATKGYLTDWGTTAGAGTVKVIDLNSNTVTGSIPMGVGPEKMLVDGQRVLVSNSGGFNFDADSVLKVINTSTDAVETTIAVTPMPNALQKDRNGRVWVICGGQYGFGSLPERAGALVRLNAAQDQADLTLPMPSVTDHPQALAISNNGEYLYYILFDRVYRMPVSATSLPAEPFITVPGANLYNLAVNPNNNDLLLLESPFDQAGKIHVYSSEGQALKVLPSGRFTNAVVFKP